MSLVLRGTVAPLAPAAEEESFAGRVFLGEDSRVEAVTRRGEAAPPGFDNAPVVDLGDSFVYPGLIDLHSHIGYASLPLWTEPSQEEPFRHHDDWTDEATYKPAISWPAWLLAKGAPEALLVYAQVRALAGGTTAIQGWPSGNRSPLNALLRNVDDEDLGTGDRNRIRTSTLTLDHDELGTRAEHLARGGGFIYHCAEGRVDSVVAKEFEKAATANCLRRGLIAIHCNAVKGEEAFARWQARAELAGDPAPGALVWSPFSNLWLYGETTDIAAARRHGVTVCLGSDWGPSGTKNLLGELKVARLWSEHAGLGLAAIDLARMVTSSPGDTLSRYWGAPLGRLVPGGLGDVAVFSRHCPDPWENLVLARPEDVELVIVGGRARYGSKELMEECGVRRTTSVRVGEQRRRVPLADPVDPSKGWIWSRVLDALENVPTEAQAARTGLAAVARGAAKVPPAIGPAGDPLLLELDMPGGSNAVAGPPPDGVEVDVPAPPSLRHDRNWRASIRGRGFHGGLLDQLERFYH